MGSDQLERIPMSAPYGSWKSPIDAKDISTLALSIEGLLIDEVTSKLYLLEQRPSEGGRNAIVSHSDGQDVFDKNWNARSRVHEYGGAPALVHNNTIYFSNVSDGRIYKVQSGKGHAPVPVTPSNPNYRYGDFTINPVQSNWIVSILEDHTIDTPATVRSTLVAVDISNQRLITLASDADFYSNPRFSPDGRLLAWKEWHHPYVPWEASEIMVSPWSLVTEDTPALEYPVLVAGGKGIISAGEPTWRNSKELLFTCDKDGYLNPWIATVLSKTEVRVEQLFPALIREDFGEPAWLLGLSSYALLNDRQALFASFRSGRAQLYLADLNQRDFKELETPFVLIQHMHSTLNGKVVFLGKKSDDTAAVIEFNLSGIDEKPQYTVLKGQGIRSISDGLISKPQPMEIRVLPEDRPAYIVFYPPTNPRYAGGLADELPPAIINLHGGPNSLTDQALDLMKQYFTSRGWVWVDVNYGGSTGYGRQYMNRLDGQWGVVDVRDSVETLRELGQRGLIDTKRAAIRGRSGGGFTTLQTLATVEESFAAGTAWFPASDLVTLHMATHKFQSQYIPHLVGAPLEENLELWKDRSPLYKANKIKAPILIMQGAMDPIVPPEQTAAMAKTINDSRGVVKYLEFEGEGHGWRKAETIQRALEEELAFYEEVFNLNH